jgi:F-type H+-transporting ATPase subunit delta
MAEISTLARPYAKAAFAVAEESKDYKSWSAMLTTLANVVRLPAVVALLDSPAISAEDKVAKLAETCNEDVFDAGKNLLTVMAENKRLELLPEVAEQFDSLRAEAEHSADVVVTSAFELSAAELEKIAVKMKARLGKDIQIAQEVDAALIGGAVIRSGDLVIDGSIRSKLGKLAEAMNS